MIVKRMWLGHAENIEVDTAGAMWNFLTTQKDSFKTFLQETSIYPHMDISNVVAMRPKFHLVNYVEDGKPVAEVRFESYEVIEMLPSGKKKTHRFQLPLQTLQCAKITYEKARQKYRDILYSSGEVLQ